jgi:hypothetical protein
MMIAILPGADGKHIAFVSNRTEDPDANSNTDIWVVDANNPNKDKKLTQVTTNPNSDNSPSWSRWKTYCPCNYNGWYDSLVRHAAFSDCSFNGW